MVSKVLYRSGWRRWVSASAAALTLAACQPPAQPIVTTQTPAPALPASPAPAPGAGEAAGVAPSPAPGAPSGGTGSSPAISPPGPAGGTGGGSPASGPRVTGRVLALGAGAPLPLAEASVATSDGRTARTDAAGEFILSGLPPADGAYVVSHPAYVASTVAGLDGAAGLTFHLATRQAGSVPVTADDAPEFVATGRVLDGAGQPLAGVIVALQDAAGAQALPAVSDAAGAFTLRVKAPAGRVVDGTLLAAGPIDRMHLGMATGLSLDASGPLAVPGGGLTMQPANQRVVIDATAAPAAGTRLTTLSLVGPHGESLGLPLLGDELMVAALPGAAISLKVEALDAYAGVESVWYDRALTLAPPGTDTRVAVDWLPVPAVTLPADWTADSRLSWAAVPGARGYVARLTSLDNGAIWEGFTAGTALAGLPGADLMPGRYAASVIAWDHADAQARQVAQARRLRLPSSLAGRYATRRVVFTR